MCLPSYIQLFIMCGVGGASTVVAQVTFEQVNIYIYSIIIKETIIAGVFGSYD